MPEGAIVRVALADEEAGPTLADKLRDVIGIGEGPSDLAGAGVILLAVSPSNRLLTMLLSENPICVKRALSKVRLALLLAIPVTAFISSSRQGCALMAPWPKIISERVNMLAPSTVMEIGRAW